MRDFISSFQASTCELSVLAHDRIASKFIKSDIYSRFAIYFGKLINDASVTLKGKNNLSMSYKISIKAPF